METVVITGVGRGIGQALAEKFLAEGWRVFGTTQPGSPTSSWKSDFQHANLKIFPLNLNTVASIKTCAKQIAAAGQIDVLINNAGVLLDEEETVLIPEKLRETLAVNLIGTTDFTEQILSAVKTGGHIINISSEAGSLVLAVRGISHYPGHYPAYKISKAALNMYTVALARRLHGQIIVSAIHPGWVKTAMGGDAADLTPAEAAANIYQFALSQPETGGFWFKSERLPW